MNTVMILFLGAAIAVGGSATLMGALVSGLAVLCTVIISNLIVNALKNLFKGSEMALALITVTGVASIVSMLLNAFMGAYFGGVATYVACVCLNLLVYALCQKDLKTAAVAGVKFLLCVCLVGAVRELFGAGAIAGVKIDFLASHTVNVLNNPAGGFMILAFVMAIFNKEATKACLVKDEVLSKVFNDKKGDVE